MKKNKLFATTILFTAASASVALADEKRYIVEADHDLCQAIRSQSANPTNPFADPDGGTWTITSEGALLDPSSRDPGLPGYGTFPYIAANPTDAEITPKGALVSIGKGSLAVHPGQSSDMDITYQPDKPGTYVIELSARNIDDADNTVGTTFSVYDGTSLIASPLDVRTREWQVLQKKLKIGELSSGMPRNVRIHFARNGSWVCCTTEMRLRIERIDGEYDLSKVTCLSSLAIDTIVSGERESEFDINDDWSAVFGVYLPINDPPVTLPLDMDRSSGGLIGWGYGAGTWFLPAVKVDPADSDKVHAHPGLGQYASISFVARRPQRRGLLRVAGTDLEPAYPNSRGVVIAVIADGNEIGEMNVPEGSSASEEFQLPQLPTGSRIELRIRSNVKEGAGTDSDDTALKIDFAPEKEKSGLVMIFR